MGVDFHALKAHSPRTKAIIRHILRLIYAKEGFAAGVALSVEAAPVDGGCLLLITPTPLRLPQDGIHVFTPCDAKALPALAATCERAARDTIIASSLYAYEGGYRLILYAPHLPKMIAAQLCEHASYVGGGRGLAAHIAEYGAPLFVGDALESVQCLH